MKASFLIVGVALIAMTATTSAIDVLNDHSIADWGLSQLHDPANWGTESSWIPMSGVIYTVENDNSTCLNDYYKEPGVHIRGPPSSSWVEGNNGECPPLGGELYDVEAIYITEDDDNIYVLIITSMPPNGDGTYIPCDLALDLDNDGFYEYGVKVSDGSGFDGRLYKASGWSPATHSFLCLVKPTSSKPETILSGSYYELKDGSGESVLDPLNPANGKARLPNYAIEVKIPKSYVGMVGKTLHEGRSGSGTSFYYTEASCGNDTVTNEIPEFPLLLIPAGIIIGFFYFNTRKKKR